MLINLHSQPSSVDFYPHRFLINPPFFGAVPSKKTLVATGASGTAGATGAGATAGAKCSTEAGGGVPAPPGAAQRKVILPWAAGNSIVITLYGKY